MVSLLFSLSLVVILRGGWLNGEEGGWFKVWLCRMVGLTLLHTV